jgi:hypothetical protein
MTYEMPSVLDVLRLLQNSIEGERYAYGGDHLVTLDELLEIVRDTADRIELDKHNADGGEGLVAKAGHTQTAIVSDYTLETVSKITDRGPSGCDERGGH